MCWNGPWNVLECVGMAHGMGWNGLEWVGMGWNGLEWLEWPLESSRMNLESVGMEFQHSGQSPLEAMREGKVLTY